MAKGGTSILRHPPRKPTRCKPTCCSRIDASYPASSGWCCQSSSDQAARDLKHDLQGSSTEHDACKTKEPCLVHTDAIADGSTSLYSSTVSTAPCIHASSIPRRSFIFLLPPRHSRETGLRYPVRLKNVQRAAGRLNMLQAALEGYHHNAAAHRLGIATCGQHLANH